MVSSNPASLISLRAYTLRRTSHWRICRRLWWLAMDSVDRSDPCSRRLPLWYSAGGYLSTRNPETSSQTQRYASEALECSKWSHPARHVDRNILCALEDVSHRAYRYRSELGSRLYLWGHVSMVHRHPRGTRDNLQFHRSAGRNCLQRSYPRCLAIHCYVYCDRYQRSSLVHKESRRYRTRGIPNATCNDRGPSCHDFILLDRMDCEPVCPLSQPHIWHRGVRLGRPVYHRKYVSESM